MLHLSFLGLDTIPPEVFTLSNLVRLDLGFNELSGSIVAICLFFSSKVSFPELPDEISKLAKLEQLWLNANPLITVSPQIEHLRCLKVIGSAPEVYMNHLFKVASRFKRNSSCESSM